MVNHLIASFYFFVLTQKSNKKSQGFRKMAKNYYVNLPGELAAILTIKQDTPGSNNAGHLHASHEDGLLRNFLNAIFLRPAHTFICLI